MRLQLLTLTIQLLNHINRVNHETSVINPRRACVARVTVVVLYVCMCVCLSAHAILAECAIKSIMKDTIVLSIGFAAILKWCFS